MEEKRLILAIVLVVFSFSTKSVIAQLQVDGQIRPLAEYRRGYDRMPYAEDKASLFVVQRTRLNVKYSYDRITSYISFQDVRTFGEEEQKDDVPSITLHEGWVQLETTNNLFLRIGRQMIQYDRGHIIGWNNWNDNQQKHDLIMLRYERNDQRIHLSTAINQQGQPVFGTPYNVDNYKYMQILWAYTPFRENKGTLSLLAFADSYEYENNPDKLYTRGNYSAFATYDFGSFNIALNPGFQNGKTAWGQDIESHYLMAEVGTSSLAPFHEASLGFEYISGNDLADTSDTKFRVWDPTYSRSNGPNGYMDYFTNFPDDTGGAGFWDYYFKNSFDITPKLTANLELHAFFLANDYVYPFDSENDNIVKVQNRYLGLEPDFVIEYAFNDITDLKIGYAFMLGTETMEVVKGGDKDEWAHFSYVRLTVKPKFFGY